MSAHEVCPDHVRYLVDLGLLLGVGGIVIDGKHRALDLGDAEDRLFIGAALVAENQSAVSNPQRSGHGSFVDPSRRSGAPNPRTLAETVQAVQWVRSYCYQASSAPRWSESTARRYTDQLRDRLEVRIIGFFETTWSFP